MPEPIEIVIRKTQEESTQTAGGVLAKKSTKKGDSVIDKAISTALVNGGKRIASYTVSQFGNMTGYSIAQKNIENALNIAGYVGQIAAGGWVGAISVGVQIATQEITNGIARDKANQQAALLYQRSGNVTIDGGRGTYD